MSVLERIVASRRRQVAVLQEETPLAAMRRRALEVAVHGGFARALTSETGGVPAIIAELKHASPSAGRLREDFAVDELASRLAQAGAAALSVLTEPDFFLGRDAYLMRVRAVLPDTPLLRKDFILEPWQVWESRALGADAVLLMASVLADADLRLLLATVREAGLEALVEAGTGDEIDRAARAGADIIGVNARDLTDFSVDLGRCENLARRIPAGVVRVAESGVGRPDDLTRLGRAGFDAALVGSALMREPDPAAVLRRWLATPTEGTA